MTSREQKFQNPSNQDRPRLRYWWPGGYVAHDLAELDRELESIAQAGFGGVEISDVYDAITKPAFFELQPETYGFTSENWKKAVKHALRSADHYNLKVDLTLGPHWPATTNEANPNEPGTAKELVYGTYTFTGTLPAGQQLETLCPPHYKTNEQFTDGTPIENQLIGVYLAEQLDHQEIEIPPAVPWEEAHTVISDQIVFASLKDLHTQVEAGRLTQALTAGDKKMIVIAIYQRGTGQRVNLFNMASPEMPDVMAPYAYVVDHFSKKGAELIQSLWQKNFLDDEFVALLQRVGDCFFEDSLELQSVGHWTDQMAQEFEKRMGYALTPYLPFVLGINQDKGLSVANSSFQVEEKNQAKVVQLRHDYYRVLNQLYQEYHLATLKQWANQFQMKFRAQPYGWAIDSAAAATHLDVVEGESLGFGEDGNDAFRMLAAGRDFGGLEILSDEAGAYMGQGYATTLPELLHTLHKNYMAGVNQTYWHGFPFKFAPGAKWPGFAAFTPMFGGRGFAEPWGPRQPVWQFLNTYTTYLGRVQQLLRYGKNYCDVLLYQAGHNATETTKVALGETLTQLGYTYQVMTEGLLSEDIQIGNEGELQVKGGRYRLLLIPSDTYLPQEVTAALYELQARGANCLTLDPAVVKTELPTHLGSSPFRNAAGDVWTYQRQDAAAHFVFCYNLGTDVVDLTAYLSQKKLVEWLPWTGTTTTTTTLTPQLQPKELRIFAEEPLDSESHRQSLLPPAGAGEVRSLAARPWTLTLEKWEMADPQTLETKKTHLTQQVEHLVAWSELAGWEHAAGICTYTTQFDLEADYPSALVIPNVAGSLAVTLNGQPVAGNPLTGVYPLPKAVCQTENTLALTVGSTLNNYLNECPLTEHYTQYESQEYGITDVRLLFN